VLLVTIDAIGNNRLVTITVFSQAEQVPPSSSRSQSKAFKNRGSFLYPQNDAGA
jgi:hypothetical protein